MTNCITDVSVNAPWRSTYLVTAPWGTPPPYTSLVGFELSMVVPDLLHIWNLGMGRDLAGSILKVVIKDRHVFNGQSIDSRLNEATDALRQYAKNTGQSLKIKRLTRGKLHWETRKYPELMTSGHDTAVVLEWLQETLQPYVHIYGDFLTLLWTSNWCFRLFYGTKEWFLTDAQRQTVRVLGRVFLQVYVGLARTAIQNKELLWRFRPKSHLVDHCFELRRAVNPSRYSTWMDEDVLKKLGKVLSMTASKTAQVGVLQRYLMGVPEHIRQAELARVG